MNSVNNVKSLIIGSFLVAGLSSCENPLKTMSEMNDTTAAMKEGTENLQATSNSINSHTENLISMSRQKEALDSRVKALSAMERKNAIEAKLKEACAYFQAFEFQLWTGQGHDSHHTREVLKESAIQEFFRTSSEYIEQLGDKKINPTETSDEAYKNINALSAAMSCINENQEILVASHSVEETSVLSIIKDGIKNRNLVERGDINEGSDLAVNFYYDRAILLLQMRQNFLMSMVLAKITDLQTRSKLSIGKDLVLNKDFPVNLANASVNRSVLITVNDWIKEANDTREFLAEEGFKVEVDSKIKEIYRLLKVKTSLQASTNDSEI